MIGGLGRNTKGAVLVGLFGVAGVVVCSVIIRPFAYVKSKPGRPALQSALTNAKILRIIRRSGEDCHSEKHTVALVQLRRTSFMGYRKGRCSWTEALELLTLGRVLK